MKAWLDCMPCALRQGLNTIRRVTDDEEVHRRVVDEIVRRLVGVSLQQTPASLSDCAYAAIRDVTGIEDPYAEEKRRSNAMAMKLVERCRPLVERSDEPLHAALKLAIMGNLIDLGIGHDLDADLDGEAALAKPFAIDDTALLRADLKDAEMAVYLGDNAGEIAFDKLVVEHLGDYHPGIEVVFVVKSKPIINDAMLADAEQVGMHQVARVIENGSGRIGTDLDDIGEELRDLLDRADVVISKGQGNFETLADAPFDRYFLLTAKCDCVAKELGVEYKDAVLRKKLRS
jgi:hypothetical protein